MPISRSNYLKRRNISRKNSIKHGGECADLAQINDNDPFTLEALSVLPPNRRFTFQGKCYDVRSLCKSIGRGITRFPHNNIEMSVNDRNQIYNHCRLLTFIRLDLEYEVDNLMQQNDLDLRNQIINNIDANVFDGLPHVTSILLNNDEETINYLRNNISTLPAGLFNGVPNLDVLNLSHNIIQDISCAQHFQLHHLTQLDLSHNIITILPNTINLQNLEVLLLNNNQITTLPTDVFSNLPNLQILALQYNEIATLPSNVFNNLLRLTELTLNNNRILDLPQNVFSNLGQLNLLTLSTNLLTDLTPGIFINLNSLRTLYLNWNQINVLRRNVFNLPALTHLQLSFNPASNPNAINVENGAFDNLFNLSELMPNCLIPLLPDESRQRCQLNAINDHLFVAQANQGAPIFDDDADDDGVWFDDEDNPHSGGNFKRNSRKIKRNNYKKSQRRNY
jgi:Leucine-rich repeat (LRR) protein